MPHHDNDMEFAIWKNDKRETDKHPHFRGQAKINGVEYWVSAWKREEGANPKAPALKGKLTPKDAPRPDTQGGPPAQDEGGVDDDIPFMRLPSSYAL